MTTRSDDRMEAELTGWLCGFEPTGTPVALRIRTFADLRDEAARPHRRFEGLTARLPPFASLGTVVVGAGLFLLLAVAGAGTGGGPIGAAAGSLGSQLSGAGTVAQPPMDDGYAIGPDPVGILMLLLASALAGCTVLIPRLRRLIGRIAFGKAATAPSVPLPFRRSWRTVTPIAWVLGALALGLTVWSISNFSTSSFDAFMLVFATNSLIMGTIALFIPVAVAWRYPLRDRAARLLLLGALATIADMLLFVVLYVAGVYQAWLDSFASFWFTTLWAFVWIFAAVALAAGIAGRAGTVRRPPLRLAVVAVGVVFMYATISLFMYGGYGSLQPQWLVKNLTGYLSIWIVQASWVAIAWVGIASWRRGRGSWGWKLVLAAGTLHVLALAPNFLNEIRQLVDPANSSIGLLGDWGVVAFATSDTGNFAITPEFWWQIVTSIASQAALLIALLIGLRPPAPKRVEPMLDLADAEPMDMAAPLGEQTRNPA